MTNQREQIKRTYQRYASRFSDIPHTDEYLEGIAGIVMSEYKCDRYKIHTWLLDIIGKNKVDILFLMDNYYERHK